MSAEMSVFYNDAEIVLPEETPTNHVKKTQTVIGFVRVSKISDIQSSQKLIYWELSNGKHTSKSNMQQQEQHHAQFNEEIAVNIDLTDNEKNSCFPIAPYLILDIYGYISSDRSKNNEFLGRVMIAVVTMRKERRSYTMYAGRTVSKNISSNLGVTFDTRISYHSEEWESLLDEIKSRPCLQYQVELNGQVTNYPGSFERLEVFIEDVTAVVNGESFSANVHLTNFRLVVVSRKNPDNSVWVSFNSISEIEKSYTQTLIKPRRCYTIKCYHSLVIKISTPAVTKGQRLLKSSKDQLQNKLNKGLQLDSSEFSSLPLISKPTDDFVDVEDGFVMDGYDSDPQYSIDGNEYSRGRMFSDADSVDSFDCLDEGERQRQAAGTSISSFTSYIKTRGKSVSKKEQKPGLHEQHSSKVLMDTIRLRILFRKLNATVNQPYSSLQGTIQRYRCEEEYIRQGDLSQWMKVDNTLYDVCASYPPLFYIPLKVSKEEILKSVLDFRSKERIPALSWQNEKGAIMLRSAQPLIGLRDRKNMEDEFYIDTVYKMSKEISGNDLPFVIFDARSKIAARGNKMKGKGTENVHNYKNTILYYLDMGNIHAVRESYDKLMGICCSAPSDKWLVKLEQTQWMYHMYGVVRGAVSIAKHLAKNGPCLVHCSDGWDRTSQLTSLALICVDPFYRTFQGFECLIVKEWLRFGHRFHDRNGLDHGEQRSPIFILWLHAVYEVMTQFEQHFEFNKELLVVLAELYCTHWTVSFTGNSQCERSRLNGGIEIWSIISGMERSLSNSTYNKSCQMIFPQCKIRHLIFWREYFLKYDFWSDDLANDTTSTVVWVPDDAVNNCFGCGETFTPVRRKHHCRLCGNIFCWSCTKRRIYIPEQGYNTPVLVCGKCYQEHKSN